MEEDPLHRHDALLLVDDEENILSALTRLLRRDGYRILRANSGAAGLELLKTEAVAVIISDQRMPEMTGVEFLSRAKERYPQTVRIVLSGYTDLKSITDAINEGAIYKFFTKPWDDELLRRNVREAFEHFNLRRENERLTQMLQHANEELRVLNRDLERRVSEQTAELTQSIRVLEAARDILESLPLGVLGITEDGLIAVANAKARGSFGFAEGGLVGTLADDALPAAFLEVYEKLKAAGGGKSKLRLLDEFAATVEVAPLACPRSGDRAWLVLLSELVAS